MKRSRLSRTAPLARAKQPLQRSKPLARGNPRLARPKAYTAILSPETRRAAFARSGGRCAVPGCKRTARDPHHLLPKQANKWPELADVAENIIAVCREHHDQHEHGNLRERLPKAVLAPLMALHLDERQRAYLAKTYR